MTEGLLRDALAALSGVGFIQGYGMTETALTVMVPREFYTPEGLARGKLAAVGRVVPGTELTIRDPQGNEVSVGTIGEEVVRGPSVTAGYVGKPRRLPRRSAMDGCIPATPVTLTTRVSSISSIASRT